MELKLKEEYKTAIIGGYDGKHQIEMLFVEKGLYERIWKDFPHFFEVVEAFDGMATAIETEKPKILKK